MMTMERTLILPLMRAPNLPTATQTQKPPKFVNLRGFALENSELRRGLLGSRFRSRLGGRGRFGSRDSRGRLNKRGGLRLV
jgi:hypothetical protein